MTSVRSNADREVGLSLYTGWQLKTTKRALTVRTCTREIESAVNRLKCGKAGGIDGLPEHSTAQNFFKLRTHHSIIWRTGVLEMLGYLPTSVILY